MKKVKVMCVLRNTDLVKVTCETDVNGVVGRVCGETGVKVVLAWRSVPIVNYDEIVDGLFSMIGKYRTYGDWFKVDWMIVVDYLDRMGGKYVVPREVKDFMCGKSISEISKYSNVSRQYLGRLFGKLFMPENKEAKQPEKRKKVEELRAIIDDIKKPKKNGLGVGDFVEITKAVKDKKTGIYTMGEEKFMATWTPDGFVVTEVI